MFGLGPPEIVLVAVAALVVFGPKRLPELARGMGKGIRDFKKALEGQGSEEDEKGALPPGARKEGIDRPAGTIAKQSKLEPASEES